MRLIVWINAFIPRTVNGYTVVVPAGLDMRKTAVPLPRVARFNPLNTFKSRHAGYLTDQRTFSESQTASVRMQSLAELQLTPRVSLVRTHHHSSGTTEVNLETGQRLGYAVAGMSRCHWSKLIELPPQGSLSPTYRTFPLGIPYQLESPMPETTRTYSLELVGQASDPLVSLASDIDYEGSFEITVYPDRPRCSVRFRGRIDAFPAFECYAQLEGRTRSLFTIAPPRGNTVLNLPGPANRPVTGTATFH